MCEFYKSMNSFFAKFVMFVAMSSVLIFLLAFLYCWDAKNLAGARIHTWPPDA